MPLLLYSEPKLPLPALLKFRTGLKKFLNVCLLLHLGGKADAFKHPLTAALIQND
jgi:hypothetical protein